MFQVTGYNSIRSMSFSVRVDEKRRADERRAATATARHTAAARARAARRIALRNRSSAVMSGNGNMPPTNRS